jgi:hypothetical protein
MKTLFLAASGTIAVVPGLLTLESGVGSPPGSKILFGGGVEAFGTLALLLLWANSDRLSQLQKRTVTCIGVSLAAFCVLCLIVYVSLFSVCVVETTKAEHRAYGPVFFPLWISGDIATLVRTKHSRAAVLNEFGPGAIADMLNEMPGITFAHIVTQAVLFLLYQAVFTCLVLAFGIVGFHAHAP